MRMRAPGMSINRVPVLTWGTLTISVGNLLAVPSVSLAFFMLWMDRQFGTHFFKPVSGGHPLLWQHLFWMFAHPWSTWSCCRHGSRLGFAAFLLPPPALGYTAVVSARSRRWCSASASGCTTCSPPAFRSWRWRFSAGLLRHHDSERGRRFRVDRDDLDRTACP